MSRREILCENEERSAEQADKWTTSKLLEHVYFHFPLRDFVTVGGLVNRWSRSLRCLELDPG